jgi:hypothetical protein
MPSKHSPVSFAARLAPNGAGCLDWTGARCRHGLPYGIVTFEGRTMHAHRLAWIFAYGPIPGRLCVLHRCDRAPCCEPTHLFLGTRPDNVADMDAKGRRGVGRHSPENFPKGERHWKTRLTDPQVLNIRADAAVGLESNVQIGARYGVDRHVVWCIINRKTWKHLLPNPKEH